MPTWSASFMISLPSPQEKSNLRKEIAPVIFVKWIIKVPYQSIKDEDVIFLRVGMLHHDVEQRVQSILKEL